jgi:hypothetical protein
MIEGTQDDHAVTRIGRRDFVRSGGSAFVGGVVLGRTPSPESDPLPGTSGDELLFPVRPTQEGRIQSFRTLGRTGFRVSDMRRPTPTGPRNEPFETPCLISSGKRSSSPPKRFSDLETTKRRCSHVPGGVLNA